MTNALTIVDVVECDELESLARELGAAYARRIKFYRNEYKLELAEAQERADIRHDLDFRQRALTDPPEQVNYLALEDIADLDPAQAIAAWQRIKAAARDDLLSGHRAAQAMEFPGVTNAWQRAQFLAIRAAFLDEWQPANGGERLVVDMLAQAYASWLAALEQLHVYSTAESSRQHHKLQESGYYDLPRVTSVEAIEQAGAMADRFNRLFLRTMRQLRDLRRYAPAVTIQNAGQVNIGQQQVNAAQLNTNQ